MSTFLYFAYGSNMSDEKINSSKESTFSKGDRTCRSQELLPYVSQMQ